MTRSRRGLRSSYPLLLCSLASALAWPGCERGDRARERDRAGGASLTLGAYSTPREVYNSTILPAFQRQWRARTGHGLDVHQSFLQSGAQARAILGGFEADVAALALEPDIEKLKEAGLIRHDWRAAPHRGIVTRSIVVIGVRRGNPEHIHDWSDLARPGVDVLTPNVRTSGGAMWNVLAIYGAARRGAAGLGRSDDEAAVTLMAGILRNVRIMDRGARDSMLTFERGVGDAIITYENEAIVSGKEGKDIEYVVPRSTILIENPVAVVDANVDRHGSRAVAEAFVQFLWTPKMQRAFARFGLRPVVPSVMAETASAFAPVHDVFTVRDLGGWDAVQEHVFGRGGLYERALERSRHATRLGALEAAR